MMMLPTPSVEYFLLSPTLIVFGVAVAGVLAEAFLPRRIRYGAQVALALGGLVAAFIAVIVVSRSVQASGQEAVLGAMAIDRPTLYLQGTVLLVAVMAVIFIAERTETKNESKVAVAAGAPDTQAAWIPLPRRRLRFPAATPSVRRSGPEPPRRKSSRWPCCPSAA